MREQCPFAGILEMSAEFDQKFQEKFRNAVIYMINASEYEEVFTRFRSAYEHRKQFPWLEESKRGLSGGSLDGLAYALRAALATYVVAEQPWVEGGAQTTSLRPRDAARSGPEWTGELMAAVAETIDEGFGLERFENRLSRAGVNVDTIPPDVLREYIAAALDSYSAQSRVGLSHDPF
jgi:hypothetical protein